jgi:ubiquinone/menaquinone biosynthesis C-methylase UbiE
MGPIDLSDLTRGYRHRPPTSATLDRARHAAQGRTGVLVDVGGGTGAHAREWVRPGMVPVVVDPSATMCREAAARDGVNVIGGVSAHLPLRDDIADLVYFHLSIHYGPFREAVDEALRVVAPEGMVEIWTFAPESMASSSLALWFPSIAQLDAQRFPPIDGLAENLARFGASVEVRHLPETVERTAASWQAAVRNRFVSTIQLLSDDEIESGLERFTEEYGDGDELYRYTVEFVRIRATRNR